MTIPEIATVYSDEDSLRRLLGILGLDQQIVDIDSAEQAEALSQFIQSGTETVNFWCGRHYDSDQLVQSRKVWDWCGIIVIYYLMSRQAATPPIIVQRTYHEALAEMQKVSNGWPLPGITKSTISAPIVHNHESNPYATRKTSPVNSQESLDESGQMTPTPWILDGGFIPFDWE